jgi:hypothetical protein
MATWCRFARLKKLPAPRPAPLARGFFLWGHVIEQRRAPVLYFHKGCGLEPPDADKRETPSEVWGTSRRGKLAALSVPSLGGTLGTILNSR